MAIARAPAAADTHSFIIGRTELRQDLIVRNRATALAAVLGLERIPGDGRALPSGWHWLYFDPLVSPGNVGTHGRLSRGAFLPDVTSSERTCMAGRITYHAPLPFGIQAEKQSTIKSVRPKLSNAEQTVLVTIRHDIQVAGSLYIEEEQDITFRYPVASGLACPSPILAPDGAQWSEEVMLDPASLFHYSELMSEGCRIHQARHRTCDEDYYTALTIDAQLLATLLQGMAERCRPDAHLLKFKYKVIGVLFTSESFHIAAKEGDDATGLDLWAENWSGDLAMRAKARFVF
ncbi:hypothetical protein M5E06_26610 [Azospirillum sp. A1-3]|uniref:hypothetical protein n=1 Tax=Azospirillum sp. A1-3 TaxID=185874 RepID=UPI0020774AFB|nr:hypothetical protein [Azospirillum sp. A1-3]MCM8737697.1 hypothetical protein [Azospirillum sp. A1-3]